MTRLKALLKKADKAAVIGMTAAAVAMAALGAGGVKTYASDYSVQKYVDSADLRLSGRRDGRWFPAAGGADSAAC